MPDWFCDCLGCHKPLNTGEAAQFWTSTRGPEPVVKGRCRQCYDRLVDSHARAWVSAQIDGTSDEG